VSGWFSIRPEVALNTSRNGATGSIVTFTPLRRSSAIRCWLRFCRSWFASRYCFAESCGIPTLNFAKMFAYAR